MYSNKKPRLKQLVPPIDEGKLLLLKKTNRSC